jgi:hypothetical protein
MEAASGSVIGMPMALNCAEMWVGEGRVGLEGAFAAAEVELNFTVDAVD